MPKNTSVSPKTLPPAGPPPSFAAILSRLQSDYPDLIFRTGKRFTFTPPKTITLGPPQPFYTLLALHELSHALLKHKHDNTHISRLKHESEAWERAKQLAAHYDIPWGPDEEDFAQDQLDTYRHHLHQKTLCPTCGTSRYESPTGTLHCPFCP